MELDSLRETNHGIGQLLQLEQFNDILTVVVLGLDRNLLRLSEVSGESKSLSDGSGPLVNILTVSFQSRDMLC
jgi:hypothetical protein